MTELSTGAPVTVPMHRPSGGTGRTIHWRQQAFLLRRGIAAVGHARRMPIATLEEAFPGISALEIRMAYRYQTRGLPHGIAYILSLITAYVAPRRIFEIGTGAGGGTLLMAQQAPQARLDTLDLGEQPSSLGVQHGDPPLGTAAVGQVYAGTPHANQITGHLGDSATFDFSGFREQIDLVLVDGAHSYEYARSDSASALAMIRPGGVILWDDCHLYHPGVSRALVGLRAQGHPVARVDGTRLAFLRVPE